MHGDLPRLGEIPKVIPEQEDVYMLGNWEWKKPKPSELKPGAYVRLFGRIEGDIKKAEIHWERNTPEVDVGIHIKTVEKEDGLHAYVVYLEGVHLEHIEIKKESLPSACDNHPMCRCTIKNEEEKENKMSKVTVTKERIERLMKTAKFETSTVFGKCTIVAAQLENGFVLVESSACEDPANYDKAMGERICKGKIRERLWELEEYALQKAVHKLKSEMEA